MFKHPEVLAKAVAEVDSILPTINSVCTYADQAKMEYLGAIMKEVGSVAKIEEREFQTKSFRSY